MAIYTEYYVQLINKRTGNPIDDDSGIYHVLDAADPTELTIYSDVNGTSGSNPGTMTNGIIQFYTSTDETSCDVSILTSTGRAFFLEGLTPSQHRVEVEYERSNWQLILPYNGNSACDAVCDTGFDLVAGMRIKDCFIHVTTICTGTGIDVGISGDTDGFFDGARVTTTGFIHANVVYTTNDTDVANSAFVSSAQKRGVLLADWSRGLTTASTGASKGWFAPKAYVVTAATSLVWVVKETNSGGTGEGYIYLEYDLLPTSGN